MSSASPLHLNEPTSIAAIFAAGQCQSRVSRCSSVRARKAELFDHLVGEQLHRVGDDQPQRLGGLEIDYQLELGRLHDGQIGGVGAPKNASAIDADLMVSIGNF